MRSCCVSTSLSVRPPCDCDTPILRYSVCVPVASWYAIQSGCPPPNFTAAVISVSMPCRSVAHRCTPRPNRLRGGPSRLTIHAVRSYRRRHRRRHDYLLFTRTRPARRDYGHILYQWRSRVPKKDRSRRRECLRLYARAHKRDTGVVAVDVAVRLEVNVGGRRRSDVLSLLNYTLCFARPGEWSISGGNATRIPMAQYD